MKHAWLLPALFAIGCASSPLAPASVTPAATSSLTVTVDGPATGLQTINGVPTIIAAGLSTVTVLLKGVAVQQAPVVGAVTFTLAPDVYYVAASNALGASGHEVTVEGATSVLLHVGYIP